LNASHDHVVTLRSYRWSFWRCYSWCPMVQLWY